MSVGQIESPEPRPLLSSRTRFSITSLAFSLASVLISGYWLFVDGTVPSGHASLMPSALLFAVVLAVLGLVAAGVAFLRREGVGAASVATIICVVFGAPSAAFCLFFICLGSST